MECKGIDIVQFRNTEGEKVSGWLVLAEEVAVYIDKTLLKDGVYQTAETIRSCGPADWMAMSRFRQTMSLRSRGSRACAPTPCALTDRA